MKESTNNVERNRQIEDLEAEKMKTHGVMVVLGFPKDFSYPYKKKIGDH